VKVAADVEKQKDGEALKKMERRKGGLRRETTNEKGERTRRTAL